MAASKEPALSRGLAVLKSVSLAARPLRFKELRAAAAGAPDSTLARLLRSLEASGHLTRLAGAGYAPGPEMRHWVAAVQQTPQNREELADEQVRNLAAATQESAAVALLAGESIRIVKSRTVPDAVSVIGEGSVLHFEADHAASLAILHQLGVRRRAQALKSPFSRIRSLAEYQAAVRATLRRDGVWLDRSRERPGICRLALGFSQNGWPGAVFLCLTVESARQRADALLPHLRAAQGKLQESA